MNQRMTPTEALEIAQLFNPVRREDQRGEIRCLLGDAPVDGLDAVSGAEQGVQARGEGEAGQGGDVVVGEIDCILRTRDAQVLNCGNFVACLLYEEHAGVTVVSQLCSVSDGNASSSSSSRKAQKKSCRYLLFSVGTYLGGQALALSGG